MNILYIAYSCDPYNGSEDKIGWNVPLAASKNHRVFVLTKEEHRENIIKFCKENSVENISFFYADINKIYKKVFRPPFYSGRLNIWHKKALSLAKEICRENEIDIIHQITPIEFRSIGKYYKIKTAKFVCGPLAGGQDVPKPLMSYLGSEKPVETLRMLINRFAKAKIRLSGSLNKCGSVIYANYETRDFLEPTSERIILPDTSLTNEEFSSSAERQTEKNEFVFLLVSRLTATKGFGLLFDALKEISDLPDFKIRIVGTGTLENEIKALFESDDKVSQHVEFIGSIPYTEIKKQYQCANALVFPSFREASGSVILEAMANSLPVITENRCGSAVICSPENAYLYSGSTKSEYINNLGSVMQHCINNPDEVLAKGKAAKAAAEQFTFEEKVNAFIKIYEGLISTT